MTTSVSVKCGGCGTATVLPSGQVGTCVGCGGMVGLISEAAFKRLLSYDLSDADMGNACYFDLDVKCKDKVVRHHGWYDVRTGRVLQVG